MKNYQIEIKWAVAFVVMTLLWMTAEKWLGLHSQHIEQHVIYTNLIAIPAIAIYVFALNDKKNNYYQGRMTYTQGFWCGFLITAIVTVLSPLTQYITSTLITPEYFPNAIAYSVKTGELTPEQAEGYFNLKNYIKQGLIGAPVMGLITTVIVAFFTRSKSSPSVGLKPKD